MATGLAGLIVTAMGLAELIVTAMGFADVTRGVFQPNAAFPCGRAIDGGGWLGWARAARWWRPVQHVGQWVDAEHAEDRAEDASGLWGGGEQGLDVGVGEQCFELAAVPGDGLDQADEPGAAAGQAERFCGEGQRGLPGCCLRGRGFRARVADFGQAAGLPQGEQAIEAADFALEIVAEEQDEGGQGRGCRAAMDDFSAQVADDRGEERGGLEGVWVRGKQHGHIYN